MADFIINGITGSGSLNFPKSDALILPAGTDPTQIISGSEWNSVCQAVVDIRKNVVSGSLFGFGVRAASAAGVPVPSGVNLNSLDFLYVRTDGALIQHRADGTEYVLGAVPSNVQYIRATEVDTIPTPTVLPTLNQGSGIIYFRSNGSRSPGSRRTQLVVRWGTDNSDTVVAEGPLY